MQQIRTPIGGEEFREAMGTVRAAKNIFWWIILLCALGQVAAFVCVRFIGVIDRAPEVLAMKAPPVKTPATAPVPAPAATTRPRSGRTAATAPAVTQPAANQAATAPAEASPTNATPPSATATGPAAARTAISANEPAVTGFSTQASEGWYHVLMWLLPTAKFLAMVMSLLLALALLLSVKLSLLGRTGGVAGFVGAFFWSLLLIVFLIPWEQVFTTSLACGALFNLGTLVQETLRVVWQPGEFSGMTQGLYYARFVFYPVLIVLILLVVQAKFARGHKRMTMTVSATEVSGSSYSTRGGQEKL